MAVELVMPRLSETMQEGTVVAWLIGDGQVVAQGQEIAEIESDMATLAWVAPEAGVLRILVPAGSRLRIGQPIGLIDDLTPLPGAATSVDPARSPAWGPAPQSGWRAPQPEEEDEGETTEFAAIAEEVAPELMADPEDDLEPPTQEHQAAILSEADAPAPPAAPVAPAQPVAPRGVTQPVPPAPVAGNPWGEQPPAPMQGFPAAPQPPVAPAPPVAPSAPAEPAVAEPVVAEAADDDRFTPEELMAPPITPPRPPEQRPASSGARVSASPVARRLANELGLDLAQIEGTGPEGRVVRADIEAAQAAGLARPPMPAGAVPAAQSEFTPPAADGPEPPLPAVDPTPEPVAEPGAVAEPEAVAEPVADAEPTAESEPVLENAPDEAEAETDPDLEVVAEPEPVADPEPEPEADEPEPAAESVTLPAAQPGRGKGEPEVVELSRQGQTIARRMAESKATIPHYALRMEVDAQPILMLRTELATNRPDMSPPSINDLVVRATALALRAHPRLNGAYRDGRVEHYPRVNVGIPVDVEDGLPVPVIHDADRLSLGQLAERSAELIEKARANELRPPDVASATFTVTNLGMLGIDDFEAVITPGQAGMITVGRIAERPVVEGGEIVPGQRMRLTLLVDHRAVYGAPAARFLARVRQLLEHPTSLLA